MTTQQQPITLATATAALRNHLLRLVAAEGTLKVEGESLALPLPPTLSELGKRFGLSRLEQRILLLCLALELEGDLPELCDRLQGNHNQPYPTFALAFAVFGESHWSALSSEGPLRAWRLLRVLGAETLPTLARPLKLNDRILNRLIHPQRQLDPLLATLLHPLGSGHSSLLPPLAPSQATVAAQICHWLERTEGQYAPPILQLVGDNNLAKQQVAGQVAANYGLSLFGLMGELIPPANPEFVEFLRLWEREERLLSLALYIDTQGATSEVALRRFLSQCSGLVFLDSQAVQLPSHREAMAIAVARPTPPEQRNAWQQVLVEPTDEPTAGEVSGRLASQFSLNWPEIERLARSTEPTLPSLWQACLHRSAPRLERLAQRLTVKANWEQLVLPEPALDLLRQIVAQVRLRALVYDDWGFRARLNRGLGTAALFAGESGTGKTMAAEVIAQDLALDLYRIDLAAVVSKYIGETEKNLSQLFDAAEAGGAMLFFDEADALFGKRSEVSDARDRYANIEIDYLLQRLESYQGLVILATNVKKALDSAFVRRFRFIVDFPFPAPDYRKTLWQKVFPAPLPRGPIDYDHLATLNLTGGAIQNIALNAAFLAAKAGDALTMTHILAAVRSEWQKLDRPLYEAAFAWDETQAAEATMDATESISTTDAVES